MLAKSTLNTHLNFYIAELNHMNRLYLYYVNDKTEAGHWLMKGNLILQQIVEKFYPLSLL